MGLKQQLKRPELRPIPDGRGGWRATPALAEFMRSAPAHARKAWRDRYPAAWDFFQTHGATELAEAIKLIRADPVAAEATFRRAGWPEATIADTIGKTLNTDAGTLDKLTDQTLPALIEQPWLSRIGEDSS